MYQYDTLSQATTGLKNRGYTQDFNLQENCLVCNAQKYHPEDFTITEVHRFEGASDPGDSSVVYAVESKDGTKGVLVAAYGYASERMTDDMVRKLRMDAHQ